MTATPYDCPTRWMVTSATDKDAAYLVDLLANSRRGQCACQHWQFRVQPIIDAGTGTITPCKHWLLARHEFTELMLRLAETHAGATG